MKKIKKILVIVIIISVMSGLSGFAEPTNKETLSREEFCTLFIDFYEDLKGIEVETDCKEPFIDTVNESVLKAYELGLVNGTTSKEFLPKKLISKENAELIFKRAFNSQNKVFNFTTLRTINKEDFFTAFKNIEKQKDWTEGAYVDYSNVNNGLLKIGYKGDNEKIRVTIEKGDKKYSYFLPPDGKIVNYPLQMGKGKYEVNVLVNIPGQKYAYTTAISNVFEVKDFGLNFFLNSTQSINLDEKLVSITKEVVGNETDDDKKFRKIYKYIINNITYDHEKIENLNADYIPDPYSIYTTKKGICYDYSSLFAAMLRIENIPTKLIKGYYLPTNGYHAWNEVYINGEWMIVDTTADAIYVKSGYSVDLEKNASEYSKKYEY